MRELEAGGGQVLEQDIDIELEMIRVARSKDAVTLKQKAVKLCSIYGIENTSPTTEEVTEEMLDLVEEYMEGHIDDDARDGKLKEILAKVLTASDPLDTPMS